MDKSKEWLLEALKAAALERGEVRLYRRGKQGGLFPQRSGVYEQIATQALQDGLFEMVREEQPGQPHTGFVRITQKGLDFLLQSESPARALEAVRETLALNEQALPKWMAQMQAKFDELARLFAAETSAMRLQLEQLSYSVAQAIERIEAKASAALPQMAPWGQAVLELMDRREQVGLGRRCSLAELFAALKQQGVELTIKEFHSGLRTLREHGLIQLLPNPVEGDPPGPEYALLDGATVHYYVERIG